MTKNPQPRPALRKAPTPTEDDELGFLNRVDLGEYVRQINADHPDADLTPDEGMETLIEEVRGHWQTPIYESVLRELTPVDQWTAIEKLAYQTPDKPIIGIAST